MLIDSHAHLDFYESVELPDVLTRAATAGVGGMLAIGIGDGPATMHRALDLAHQHPHVWASAGIHPSEAAHATPEALGRLAELAADPRCVAVGEIGLDYYHLENPDISVQQRAFVAQMRIAAEAGKPILIHCRTSELATPAAKARFVTESGGPCDAFADLMRLIDAHWRPHGIAGVMHCFSGSPAEARQALDAGFYLSFAGNVTYPRSTGIQQAAAEAPAERILVETDCPFLTPVPLRGQRNEPANVVHTAAFLAGVRGVSAEDVAFQTTANFRALFPVTA
jgi:TatD DNase family protein